MTVVEVERCSSVPRKRMVEDTVLSSIAPESNVETGFGIMKSERLKSNPYLTYMNKGYDYN